MNVYSFSYKGRTFLLSSKGHISQGQMRAFRRRCIAKHYAAEHGLKQFHKGFESKEAMAAKLDELLKEAEAAETNVGV